MGRPISWSAGKHLVPFAQRLLHALSGGEQLLDLTIDRVKDVLRSRSHVVTRLPTRVTDIEKLGDLSERKSEPLRVPHHVQPVNHRLQVKAVPGSGTLWTRQQPEAFVIANRAGTHTTQRRELANRQESVHLPNISTLDLGVHCKVYDCGMSKMRLLTFLAALNTVCPLMAQTAPHSMPPEMTHEEHLRQLHKDAELKKRGNEAMGFDQDAATHHFRLTMRGGAIEVAVRDPADAVGLERVRSHLREITEEFAMGAFAKPLATHGELPPGVPVMRDKIAAISYTYEDIPAGGRVNIVTTDTTARAAVHDFLRYQIQKHATGDVLTITK